MFILAVVHEDSREGRGGKLVVRQVAVAIDRLNIILAEQFGNGGFVGISWCGCFNHLRKALVSKGICTKVVANRLWEAICPILSPSCKLPSSLTLKVLDRTFSVSERKSDTSGMLTLYDRLHGNSKKVGSFDRFLTGGLSSVVT